MINLLVDFMDDIAQLSSVGSIMQCYERSLEKLGFDRHVITPMFDLSASSTEVARNPAILAKTYPGWQQYYTENRFYEIDPTIQLAMLSRDPFVWDRHICGFPMSEEQVDMMRIAVGEHHGWGVTIPIRQNGRMSALATVSNRADECNVSDESVRAAQGLAISLHQKLSGIHLQAKATPNFSDRELDCLLLLAEGHTGRNVAEILGITERTVKFHLTNARVKNGNVSTIQAVIMAAHWKAGLE